MAKCKCKFCGYEFEAPTSRKKYCELCEPVIRKFLRDKKNRMQREERKRENDILRKAEQCAGTTGKRARVRGSLGLDVFFSPNLEGCKV